MKTLYEWTMQVQEVEKKAAESTTCIQDIAVAQLTSLHKEIMEMQMHSISFCRNTKKPKINVPDW